MRYFKWLAVPAKILLINDCLRVRMEIFPDGWAGFTQLKIKKWYGYKWKFLVYTDNYEPKFGYYKDGTTLETVKKDFNL